MPTIRTLTETDLRAVVTLDQDAVACVENAFATLAGGGVVMPPILSLAIHEHNGEVDVKTAYVPGLDSFAIKMSPGFFDNPKLGLPSTSGLMILFSVKTGVVEALLLDNGYLTDVRTAAAGAVAAKHLARADAKTACIVGTGAQARLQLMALCLVRPIQRAMVWGRDTAKAVSLADHLASELDIEVVSTTDLGAAVQASDIVVTTTPSTVPLIQADWLCPGQHVTAMGSDQSHKCELQPACLAKADLYVPDRQAQTAILGELRAALDADVVTAGTKFPELGEIISGTASGRTAPHEITIADLTGTGVQDTAIANLARERAVAAGTGMTIES